MPHFTLYTFHPTLYTLLHTPHSHTLTLCTLHPTLHTFTVHSTLYILDLTPHTLHSAPDTLHYTLHPRFTLHTLHCTLYTSNLSLRSLHFTLHSLNSLSLRPQLWFRGSLSYVWAFGFVDFILFLSCNKEWNDSDGRKAWRMRTRSVGSIILTSQVRWKKSPRMPWPWPWTKPNWRSGKSWRQRSPKSERSSHSHHHHHNPVQFLIVVLSSSLSESVRVNKSVF